MMVLRVDDVAARKNRLPNRPRDPSRHEAHEGRFQPRADPDVAQIVTHLLRLWPGDGEGQTPDQDADNRRPHAHPRRVTGKERKQRQVGPHRASETVSASPGQQGTLPSAPHWSVLLAKSSPWFA